MIIDFIFVIFLSLFFYLFLRVFILLLFLLGWSLAEYNGPTYIFYKWKSVEKVIITSINIYDFLRYFVTLFIYTCIFFEFREKRGLPKSLSTLLFTFYLFIT